MMKDHKKQQQTAIGARKPPGFWIFQILLRQLSIAKDHGTNQFLGIFAFQESHQDIDWNVIDQRPWLKDFGGFELYGDLVAI